MTAAATTTDQTSNQSDNQANNTLTTDERKALNSCEATIRNGQKAFFNVGRALSVIRTDRLYRAAFATFDAYAAEKWDMTRQRVSQLIASFRIYWLLKSYEFTVLPATESQCRPFSRVPEDMRYDDNVVSIWSTVTGDGERVTAKAVAEATDTIIREYVLKNYPEDSTLYKQWAPKQDNQTQDAGGSAGAGGTTAGADTADKQEDTNRALIRELQRKIAFLESTLAAEKKAHQRTQASKGNTVPTSKLAKDLFKAGFKAMARQHHPDLGGNVDTMQALNELKSDLGI